MRAHVDGPDFLCIGSQKAGTTWLYDQIALHPDVWMPPVKELHYFSSAGFGLVTPMQRAVEQRGQPSRYFAEGSHRTFGAREEAFFDRAAVLDHETIDFDAYKSLFSMKGAQISGDVTPNYSHLPETIVADIAKHLPDTKIIFIARHPVDRFWSQMLHEARTKRIDKARLETWDGVRALLDYPGAPEKSYPTRIAETWRRHFPSEHVHAIVFDDIAADPAEVRAALCRFLGIDCGAALPIAADFDRKSRQWRMPMPDDVRAGLAAHFRDETETCAAMFDGRAKAWPDKYAA